MRASTFILSPRAEIGPFCACIPCSRGFFLEARGARRTGLVHCKRKRKVRVPENGSIGYRVQPVVLRQFKVHHPADWPMKQRCPLAGRRHTVGDHITGPWFYVRLLTYTIQYGRGQTAHGQQSLLSKRVLHLHQRLQPRLHLEKARSAHLR